LSTPPGPIERRPLSWKEAAAPGYSAVKHSWAPILLLQCVAALLVAAYYLSPGLQHWLEWLERLKSNGGVAFDVAVGVVVGGVVPQVAKALTGKTRLSRAFFGDMAFNGFVYAIVATEVDHFYRFQGSVFGTGVDIATIAKKIVVDMGLFTPFLCIPTAIALFEVRNAGFSWNQLIERNRGSAFRTKVIQALIPCWAFWIPMLVCVYSMPKNLQFPLSQTAQGSWAVLFIFMATDHLRDAKGRNKPTAIGSE
jgi:hypothetical protein